MFLLSKNNVILTKTCSCANELVCFQISDIFQYWAIAFIQDLTEF